MRGFILAACLLTAAGCGQTVFVTPPMQTNAAVVTDVMKGLKAGTVKVTDPVMDEAVACAETNEAALGAPEVRLKISSGTADIAAIRANRVQADKDVKEQSDFSWILWLAAILGAVEVGGKAVGFQPISTAAAWLRERLTKKRKKKKPGG